MCDISTICINTVENEIRNIPKWNQICDSDICKYENCTYTHSRDVVIPDEVLLCRDTNCSIHNQDIDSLYKSIMSVFKQYNVFPVLVIVIKSNSTDFLSFPGGMNTLESTTKLIEMHLNGGT